MTIHLWATPIDFEIGESDYTFVWGHLDETIRQRVVSRRFSEDRIRSLASYDALVRLVRKCQKSDDTPVFITAGVNGKPTIETGIPLHINLSHRDDWCLVAVGGNPVGVDIDRIPDEPDLSILRYFAPSEREWVTENSDYSTSEAITVLWTLKESYLKAFGTGLGRDLDSFRIEWEGDNPVLIDPVLGTTDTALLVDRRSIPGFVAASSVLSSGSPIDFSLKITSRPPEGAI